MPYHHHTHKSPVDCPEGVPDCTNIPKPLRADDFEVPPVPPRATGKVPDVILDAGRLGIRLVLNVPDVILDAERFGMRSVLNVPALILLAFKLGILASANVPELISLALCV